MATKPILAPLEPTIAKDRFANSSAFAETECSVRGGVACASPDKVAVS